ncbi:hypothetical protein [Flammeovirga aprica]|uniref:DUF4129 domain-containing protein n=1 Tax=Flammeovirga aprica JL-4 TaxID=694437 RepID=A0A7X9XBL7_9BACT|nr:hypothetical protein [Flammeovirga aprica]NME70871.1 hypothetical protein [Flammeovirga aprica JL-4]
MRKYIVLIYIFFVAFAVNAQEREFSKEKLSDLKENGDYTYELPTHKISASEKFSDWFVDYLSKFFDVAPDISLEYVVDIIKLSIAILFIWGIFLVLKSNHIIVFRNREKFDEKGFNTIYSPNQDIIPLSTQLKEAIKAKDYHEIVRLYYLLSIDQLDKKGIINLKKVDHHNDILLQLKEELIKKTFHSIGVYFQYCWYGEFDANETIYQQVKDMYNDFETAVSQYEKVQ